VLKFVLGEHESVEVLADAIYAAQVDKRGRSYGGNFADVELPADEVAFIFKFGLHIWSSLLCYAFYANISL
jgi:hypothetical protein